MKIVTARNNAALKLAHKLTTKKGRDKEEAFLIEGEKLLEEALKAGFQISHVFVRAGTETKDLLEKQIASEDNLIVLSDSLFDELSSTVTPQPIIAVVKTSKGEASPEKVVDAVVVAKGIKPSEIKAVILDRIGDPGNVGTIIRTACAAGFDVVITIKGSADIYSDKVIRSSAGSIFHIPIIQGIPENDCLKLLDKINIDLMVCSAEGDSIYDTDISGGKAILIGNEANGPQDIFYENAKGTISIPMEENAESLNAAIAAAIVMYEKRRQDEDPR